MAGSRADILGLGSPPLWFYPFFIIYLHRSVVQAVACLGIVEARLSRALALYRDANIRKFLETNPFPSKN